MTPVVVLTIAGSDSSGGAGVQADLRTFAAHAVHGACAIAALTAQNTVGVDGIRPTPPTFLVAQVTSVLDDLDVVAVKTGMLATAANVRAVAELARAGRLPNLVVDPVMVASTGARLLDRDAERAYRDELLPLARIVTPNRAEAAALVGHRVESRAEVTAAATRLAATGPEFVVVTGGGEPDGDMVVDLVVDTAGSVTELTAPRVATGNDHGTGCSFASATAARLALGDDPLDALRAAKRFVHRGLLGSATWQLGAGHGPIDHLGWNAPDPQPTGDEE